MIFYNFFISILEVDVVIILIIIRVAVAVWGRFGVACTRNLLNVIRGLVFCVTFSCAGVIRFFVGSCLACISIVCVILAIIVII